MADDNWRNQRRNWREAGQDSADRGRWTQGDAPQFGRWNQGYARLGYGPYARREGWAAGRMARHDREDEPSRRSYGQGYREGDEDRRSRYDEDRVRSDRAGAYGGGYRHGYDRDYGRGYDRDDDRGWVDRAGDEVASWFGDDEAEYRRRMDRRRDAAERDYRRNDDDMLPGRRWRDDW